MFSDATWLLLDHFGIILGDILMIITVCGAVWGFVMRNTLRNWLLRNRFPVTTETSKEEHWDGIVFTVSRADTPRWVIETRLPSRVGLIATEESHAAANELTDLLKKHNLHLAGIHLIENADDPDQTRSATAALLALMQSEGARQFAVDVTGGKTTMSLGAFMAAEEAGAETLYVACQFDQTLKRPNMKTARLLSVSKPIK